MREVKFRALDKNYSVLKPQYRWLYFELSTSIYKDLWPKEYDPETICQFTGLTDHQGVEIYEGDIVRVGGLVQWVRYIDGILICSRHDIEYVTQEHNTEAAEVVDSRDYFEPYEVIGNIYENKELLK